MEDNTNRNTALNGLNRLCNELKRLREAYLEAQNAGTYPGLNALIVEQYAQKSEFLKILNEEYQVLRGDRAKMVEVKGRLIGNDFAQTLSESHHTKDYLYRSIIEQETTLVEKYRQLLLSERLPGTTDAILQAQAEQINANIEKLELDRRTDNFGRAEGVAKKEKDSQIRDITD
ncbi:MAG: hypothetical protein WBG48_06420 [Pricia sp.]